MYLDNDVLTGGSRSHTRSVASDVGALPGRIAHTTEVDLLASLDHGADAAGAASAFVDASDREAWLSEIAESLTAEANSFDDGE
ncbi:hypothetical protein ACFQL3_01400 [Natronoarchaeum sp. GCM10025321]|uniref:hypothetical protein n=1 Tax=Natronoarchaeum sp. GCM10025321 TaxID=3252684 RepID=UPI00361D7E2B